ncbi:hypothetical protein ColKHC_13037 [Colletotrichum higginsianum]|nr:hypothetical protein ColKHC_13037 [Colletotrichum higginsianum]
MDDQELLENIDGRMHGPMSGFIKKYFGSFQYARQDASLEIQTAGVGVGGRCAIPSTAPSPDSFLQWFSNHASRELDGARGSWHISSGEIAPEHQSARLLLTMPTSPAANVPTKWDQVQVVGQFYRHSCVCYQDGLLRLCQSAQQVFASQPTRLFLHGFYIRGSLIELWAFDRSGLYCSDVFDVQEDFIQFFSILVSYQWMTDQDLGKSDLIEADEGGSYIVLDSEAMPSLGKLYLEGQPIASRESVVGTGTTCYRARMPDSNRWDYVLKFKWRWARQRPEDELLKLVQERRVWGAISLDYYKELERHTHPGDIQAWMSNDGMVLAAPTDSSTVQKKPTISFKIASFPASSLLPSADPFAPFSLMQSCFEYSVMLSSVTDHSFVTPKFSTKMFLRAT